MNFYTIIEDYADDILSDAFDKEKVISDEKNSYYTCLFFLGSLECIRNDLGQTEIQWVEFSRHLLKHIGFSESYLSNFFINKSFT